MENDVKSLLHRLVSFNRKPLQVITGSSGYEKITVTGGTAQKLTIPADATYCEIRVESATTSGVIMRYLLTGVAPTTTDGMPLSHLDFFDVTGAVNLNNFKILAVSGSHTLHVQYYK